jgi:hypothetical protein
MPLSIFILDHHVIGSSKYQASVPVFPVGICEAVLSATTVLVLGQSEALVVLEVSHKMR